VRSQRELLDAAAHQLDAATLHTLREHEAGELVFRARGLSVEQAERRAAAVLGEHDDEPAGAEDEAGTDVVGSALAAAGSSSWPCRRCRHSDPAVFLALGTAAIATAAVVVGVALFATGATGC
jgi:vacuolar iron transporter family protein